MLIWFPGFACESYRRSYGAASLVVELAKQGVDCTLDPAGNAGKSCDFFLSMDLVQARAVRAARVAFPKVPWVCYSWDVYPWAAEGRSGNPDTDDRWRGFIADLKDAREVWVPSSPQIDRHVQYARLNPTAVRVVKCGVAAKCDVVPWNGGYVLDPLRDYQDPGNGMAGAACARLGVEYRHTAHGLSWEDFKRELAGAAVVVTTKYEASTGGLSLLEAYAIGKPVVVSDSPWNGARDYFGSRATYFKHDSVDDLAKKLELVLKYAGPLPADQISDSRDWVDREYSEDIFARRIADRLKTL